MCFFTSQTFAAITGAGTWVSPYTGTITSSADNFTISGTKYFNIISVSGGGTLTISAGATLWASATSSSITITGTGILSAVGNSNSIIKISADNDGSGLHDSGETWRNINFSGSSGTSVIDYAVIEYGLGSSQGGGIRIFGNNITISNSTVQNCSAGSGGGIYARPNGGSNVTLSNLKVHDNTAGGSGGGIYVYGNPTISGCEIYNNTSSNSGVGVFFFSSGSISNSLIHDNNSGTGEGIYGSASISVNNCVIYNNLVGIYFYADGSAVNCDVVNNTTGITSVNSIPPKIVNTVLWGNSTQYSLEAGASMELAYCAIQGGFTVGNNGGGNKTLNATNGADTGPNFVDISTDFHIKSWITPIVDGAAESYAGVTIPGTDIEGKSRIGTLDIGAYEFIYYIWTGGASNTTWAASGNWLGSPSSIPTAITDNKVIIPKGCSFYPTTSSLSLSTRSVLTIEPQAGLKVTGSTVVGSGCTFLLKSDATGSANFISGTSVSGSFNVELFLLGGGGPSNFRWHYVTTPVHNIGKAVLTTNISNTNNLLNYTESKVTTDRMSGWNWHDSYDGTTSFNTLLKTKGYNVYVATDKTALFIGSILSGSDFYNQELTWTYTLDPDNAGWNFMGNPFTSSVDLNNIIMGSDIDGSVYYTKDNGFLNYNVIAQIGLNGATNIIPALQGFFVHATSDVDPSVIIPGNSRVYSDKTLYKGAKAPSFPLLKFNVSDGLSTTDEALIYFFSDAKTTFDKKYDAYKFLSDSPSAPQIYSLANDLKLSMNALPLPETITTIPLNIRINLAKNYTINVLNLENLADYNVTLIHGTNRMDLKANPTYTFPAAVGTLTDMSIEFALSIPTDINANKQDQTSVWYSKESLYIKTAHSGFENNSSLVIYDVNGRVVLNKGNLRFGKGEIVEVPVNLPGGFYITTVKNKNQIQSNKIVISH